MLLCISIAYLFLLLNSILHELYNLYEYTAVCLSIALLMDISVVSSLELLWIKLRNILIQFFCGHVFVSFGWNYWAIGNHQTFPQSSCTVFQFHQPCCSTTFQKFGVVSIFNFSYFMGLLDF